MRIKLMTLCMALCCLCFNAFAQNVPDYVPTDGLVAWYDFDGDVSDASDNAHNGSVFGASFAESPLNGAVSFDGTDDYLEIPTSSVFEDMVHELTLSAWFKKTNSNTGTIVAKRNFVGNPCGERHHFELTCFPDNSVFFSASHNCIELNNTQVQSAPGIFELNEWTHVSVTYDNGVLLIYVNGDLVLEFDEGYRELLPNDHWINFGRIHRSGGTPFFNEFAGDIDESGIWNRVLTAEEILALYIAEPPVFGCTDPTACNFNEEANIEDDSCVYPLFGEDCETGGAACGEGTIWDSSLQSCVGFDECPSDLNDDGIVGINDLLSLLSDFGTMCEEPETGEFTCGDPMNYHGYDYATVQIGEQCWFAENLRTSFYLNGDSVAIVEGNSDWLALANDDSGAMVAYENTEENSAVFGTLYNGYAVLDNRKLCPLNWKVPSDSDWQDLELNLGMSTSELNSESWRGATENIGTRLKVDAANSPSWNGSNTTLWSGLPAGYRHPAGGYNSLGSITLFWSQGLVDGANPLYDYLFARQLNTYQAGVKREREMALRGFSVRCLRD
jgi:uncharacterized protein (TIGR02145 family)